MTHGARVSASDFASAYIRKQILAGDLLPGSRIPQDDIAHRLGVSRIPVREALIGLEREGWVTIEMNRGATVCSLEAGTVRDGYELFGQLYGFAARKALARSRSDLTERLIGVARQAQSTNQPGEFCHLAHVFYTKIVEGAESPRIGVLLRAMSGLLPDDFFSLMPAAIGAGQRGLLAIAAAMQAGDGDDAAGQCTEMMTRIGEHFIDVLGRRGLLSEES
jgi:DNA-binding GntR family transcriptional regulator